MLNMPMAAEWPGANVAASNGGKRIIGFVEQRQNCERRIVMGIAALCCNPIPVDRSERRFLGAKVKGMRP